MSGTQPADRRHARPRGTDPGRPGTDRGPRERTQRARQRHAHEAERKVEHRRRKQTGVAGWVSDRASEWSLDGPDCDFLERQKYFWNPLMDYWFRMEIERLGAAPRLRPRC